MMYSECQRYIMRFKTDIEAVLLGALSDGPLHGYGIVKALRERSDGMFNLPESQLYPLLHRLQKAGWIRGEWQVSESGPARKTYTLLEEGRSELKRRKEDWQRFTTAVGALLATKEPKHA
jgi:PadR family transcriptional regulator PadR